jgi:hypothetical protein
MNRTAKSHTALRATLLGMLALGAGAMAAEGQPLGMSGGDPTNMAGAPSLTGELVDPAKKAPKHTATVKLSTTGVVITDPAKAMEKPKPGQAHFHYQVDDGPVIATTAPTLSFHDLTSGSHKITVTLAANDHSPVGKPVILNATIP